MLGELFQSSIAAVTAEPDGSAIGGSQAVAEGAFLGVAYRADGGEVS
jgi:hypothetical protein